MFLLPSLHQNLNPQISEVLDKFEAISKSQEEQISGLKAKMDQLKEELKEELRCEIKAKMDKLKLEADLKREIKSITDAREILFKFELVDVSKFFKTPSKRLSSGRFWCAGLQWSIHFIWVLSLDKLKYLSFNLLCHNDDRLDWSCKTSFKLIFYHSTAKAVFTKNDDRTYKPRQAFGFESLISYPSLVQNGYIKNDRVEMAVVLKAEPVRAAD